MKQSSLVIRTARAQDLKVLLDIVRENLKYDVEFARRYYKLFFNDFDEMTEDDEVYVALIDGKAVGVIGYARDYLSTDFSYWLGWFAVRRAHRRQKVGSKLLRRVEKDLKAMGKRKVFVSAEDSDSGAKSFYTRHGFRTEGVVRDYYSKGENELIMSKALV
jgi:ribosomal protein S18 acetylase RimI-like enzyme